MGHDGAGLATPKPVKPKKPEPLPDLSRWWPFTRMDTKLLDALERQYRKKKPEHPPALL